jgi:hypothetical protein
MNGEEEKGSSLVTLASRPCGGDNESLALLSFFAFFAAIMSVILVTGSYDHEIRFWEAWSGICSRTIARSGETGVSASLRFL